PEPARAAPPLLVEAADRPGVEHGHAQGLPRCVRPRPHRTRARARRPCVPARPDRCRPRAPRGRRAARADGGGDSGVAAANRYGTAMITKDDVVEALHGVEDPELGMDIVELGLYYDSEIEGEKIKVIHSLTSMGCPAGPMIQEGIHEAGAH